MIYKLNIVILGLLFTFEFNAQTVYLYTPNGSQVYAFLNTEMSNADITYYTNQTASTYPNATVLANASRTYNCHSYAWNKIEGGSTCWLNQYESQTIPNLSKYWTDGSYEQTTEEEAKKIFYYNGDHSAVKSTTHSGNYESKWGSLPLMRHSPEYGPSSYNMQYRRYYKKSCLSTNFFNHNVTSNTTISCGDINVQNVTVQNNAKLTLDAIGSTIITNTFEVKFGSELEIK